MCDFIDEFAKAMKEIHTMLDDFPLDKQLEIINNYENELILQSTGWGSDE